MGIHLMAGRPTDYSPEMASVICSRIAKGESIRSIDRDENMPSATSIFLWLQRHTEFTKQYEIATLERIDGIFEETLEISDDGTNDWMERRSESEKGAGISTGWVLNGEHVQRSRLRVDTRKWMLSKMMPKKYGDKIQNELTGADGGPVQITEIVRRVVDPKAS